MTYDELVEVVAKKIADTSFTETNRDHARERSIEYLVGIGLDWGKFDFLIRDELFRSAARAALSSISKAGWAVVPVVPTREMCEAYKGALAPYIESLPECERAKGGRFGYQVKSGKKLRLRWEAMLSSAPKLEPSRGE